MTQFNILMSQLNDNKKVFVDLYEQQVLLQVTKDNIDMISCVEIDDDSLEQIEASQQSRVEYFSQNFEYRTDCFSQHKIDEMKKHTQEMLTCLSKYEMSQMYHVDCVADVYVFN